MSKLRDRALALYKPPFKLDHGYIFDSDGNMAADQAAVLRIRGWGRIGYMDTPEDLQDMVGELIVEALNKQWNELNGIKTITGTIEETVCEWSLVGVTPYASCEPRRGITNLEWGRRAYMKKCPYCDGNIKIKECGL